MEGVPFVPEPFHLRRPQLVAPARRDPEGRRGPTTRQVRSGEFRRTSHGLWVPAHVECTPEQRSVEAAAVFGDRGAVTGWAGLRWLGGVWFDGRTADGRLLAVPGAVHGGCRHHPGMAPSWERMAPDEWEVVDGLAVTVAARSALFEMRHAPDVRAATRVADMAAYSDLVSREELRLHAERQWTMTGIPQARTAIGLMDENAWSPAEVAPRLVWALDLELPPLLCNRPVFDRYGRHVATPDLLDAESGTAFEWEGPGHLDGRQRTDDVDREDRMRGMGLEVQTLRGGQGDLERIAARMLAARRRARWADPSERAWTLDPPRWWVPTFTVAQRRGLDERQRGIWLAHRRRVG